MFHIMFHVTFFRLFFFFDNTVNILGKKVKFLYHFGIIPRIAWYSSVDRPKAP